MRSDRFLRVDHPDIGSRVRVSGLVTLVVENQMETKIELEMETGVV